MTSATGPVGAMGRLGVPPRLEVEDIGGGMDKKDRDAREAEDDLGLRGEVVVLSQERLVLGIGPFVRECNFSFGADNAWNSQGVTSSLARPALVLLDGRPWWTYLRGCMGEGPGRGGAPPPSIVKDVLEGGVSGTEVRSRERVLENGEPRIAVAKGPSTERWCLGMETRSSAVYVGSSIKM